MEKRRYSLASPHSLAVLAGMIAAAAVCAVIAAIWVDFQNPAAAVNLFFSVVALIFTILLYTFCINSIPWDERQKRAFSRLVEAVFLCNLAMLLSSGSDGDPRLWRLNRTLDALLFLLPSLCWLLFWFFQRGNYRHPGGEKLTQGIFFGFFGVYCVLTVINYFTGFCFTTLPDGSFVIRSRLLYELTVLWFFLYLVIALLTKCPVKTRLTLASYSLVPLLAWLPMFCFPVSAFFQDIFASISVSAYMIPLYLLFFNLYLDGGQLYLQREKELEESRANAMMLKISPHFIANTMSSIVALCDSDAEKAGELASRFAGYLRDNYADMGEEMLIPFSVELEHIRNYLAIEEIRFPGLRVEYDVRAEAFLLPTLTVQPLVENAVRHGVSKRPDASGTVKIRSFEDEEGCVIRIEDDGAGYHPAQTPDGRRHIGIPNARTRLSLLSNGTLTVEALPERGTVCEIRIPKGENV